MASPAYLDPAPSCAHLSLEELLDLGREQEAGDNAAIVAYWLKENSRILQKFWALDEAGLVDGPDPRKGATSAAEE
jgi:hypothetical protein